MRVTHLFGIFWCIYFISFAQPTPFHLGLKAEFYGYTHQEVSRLETYHKKFWLSPLPAMYVLASYDLSEEFSICAKPGLSFRPVNGNFELGFGVVYNLDKHKYFLTSGVNMYFTHVQESKSDIYFLFLGVGYKLTNRLDMDISFHQALNTDFAFTTHNALKNGWEGQSKLHNMIKFGLAATF